jgi:hypothetical protein
MRGGVSHTPAQEPMRALRHIAGHSMAHIDRIAHNDQLPHRRESHPNHKCDPIVSCHPEPFDYAVPEFIEGQGKLRPQAERRISASRTRDASLRLSMTTEIEFAIACTRAAHPTPPSSLSSPSRIITPELYEGPERRARGRVIVPIEDSSLPKPW